MLQPGSTLGPYVLESLLAEGGMGAVYRAKNRVTGQLRALKVVRPELSQKRDFIDRFVREATIASQLRHPNLVETLEPGIDGEIIYLPMELLEGETLAHMLKKRKRLTPKEAGEILAPVANAVQALHDRGVVHRDLKPMNIFVTPGPGGTLIPKVIDLGTARDVDDEEHTRTGMVVGSPFYMAPEQAEGRRDIDGRADQYALGVIAYQMITGARPYESDDTRSALAKLLRGEPFAPPSRHFPGLHAAVEAVIVRSLDRERDHRFKRIDEFGAAMVASAAGLPIASAAPMPMPGASHRPGPPPIASQPPAHAAPLSTPPPGSALPLGTPGPFAPPPDAPAQPRASRAPLLVGVLVVLALLGVGTAALVWQLSPTMTATPLAPRSPTVVGAAPTPTPSVSITTTPVIGPAATVGAAPETATAPIDGTGAPIAAPPPAPELPAVAPPPSPELPAVAPPVAAVPPTTPRTGTPPATTDRASTSGSPAPSTPSASSGSTRSASSSSSGSSSGSSTSSSGSTRTGSSSGGSPRSGSRSGDDERGSAGSHGAPCGAATGIPCLE